MSHALDFSNGRANIAYRGETPWHGYGDVIGENDSLEDIIKKAGLDHSIVAVPSQYVWNDEVRTVPNRVQLVRSDTGESLSEMSGNTYKIRQPSEIVEFFRNLCEGNELQMNVAGSLHGGRKIWAMAERLGHEAEIKVGKTKKSGTGDIIKPYVLLVESYDGTHATTGRFTSVRVVCQNTLSLSGMIDAKTQVKQKHSQDFDIKGMQIELAKFDEDFASYIDYLQEMATFKMSEQDVLRYFSKLYAPEVFLDPEDWQKSSVDMERPTTNAKNNVISLLEHYEDNLGHALSSADGTLYGALQTVTFFQDHEARTKGNKRWESATIGAGNRKKNEALNLAMQVVNKAA